MDTSEKHSKEGRSIPKRKMADNNDDDYKKLAGAGSDSPDHEHKNSTQKPNPPRLKSTSSTDFLLQPSSSQRRPRSNSGPSTMSNNSINDVADGETTYPQTPAAGGVRHPPSLQTFRTILGINAIPPTANRPAQNIGTYKRLVDAELKARVQYYTAASIINTGLLAQIVIGAALTALGASNGPHIAITVLGSLNTVIAGGMTYLKGQGLPERLLVYANGLRKVREYLEERERQFMRPDCKLDVDRETRDILRMYEAVRQKAEDSYLREQSGPDADVGKKKTGKKDDDARKDDKGKARDLNDTLPIPDNDGGGSQTGLKDDRNEIANSEPKTTSGGGPIVNK